MATLTVKCKATREMYKKDNFRIVAFEPMQVYKDLKLSKYLNFSAKGDINYITIGKEYTLEIEELETNIYGTSYRIISVPSMAEQDIENLTTEQAREILLECTTSKRIAENILKVYPDYVKIVLTEGEDAIDVEPVRGMGKAYHKSYCRTLNEKYKYFHIMQDNKDYRIDISDCKDLVSKYKNGEGVKKAFADYPYYVLTEILKRGFEQVDKMLMDIRPELKESDQRVESLIIHVLRKNELGGSTRLDASKLFEYINNSMNVPYLIPKLRDVAISSDYIYYDQKSNDLSVYDTYLAECKIADFVKEKLANSRKLDIDWKKYKKIKDGELTEEQSNILKMQCESSIVIINARGGTGKTSVLKASIEMFEDNNLSYTLLSPTGMVAQVIKSQTSKNAMTVHRACLSGEINTDIVVVEEASMLSIDLLCMLINAISNPNIRIYFNLDLGQIAPIGIGCPLRDIIKSGKVPTCTLNKVFRYGEGGLYKMATDAYDMKFYIDELDYNNKDRISVGKHKDYTYVRYDGTVEQIINEYMRFIDRKIKPIDIAVITPWNVTDFGTINLNNKIQELINPPRANEECISRKISSGNYHYEITYRIGDLILNTKNNYKIPTLEGYNLMKSDSILSADDVDTTCVMNGEIGLILNIENGFVIAQFGEEIIVFDKGTQRELLLGQTLTSYKLQGSERPYVITLITPQFEKSLSKNIIYTDMSRTRKEVVEIIDPDTLSYAILIDSTEERETWLGELLING